MKYKVGDIVSLVIPKNFSSGYVNGIQEELWYKYAEKKLKITRISSSNKHIYLCPAFSNDFLEIGPGGLVSYGYYWRPEHIKHYKPKKIKKVGCWK